MNKNNGCCWCCVTQEWHDVVVVLVVWEYHITPLIIIATITPTANPQSPAHVNKIVPQWCHGMPQTCHCVTWDAGECYSHKQDKQIKSGRNKNTSCTITIIVKTLHCQFILASGLLAGCLRSESFWWLALVKCCLTGYFLLLYLHGERTHRTTQGRQETGWHT